MRNRRLPAAVVLAAVIGLGPAGCGFGADSPEEFVESKYKRATKLDPDAARRSYTTSKSPGSVQNAITKDWKPLETFSDAGGTYLHYSDRVIAVRPNGSGTVVDIEDEATGCPRYRNAGAVNWTCGRGSTRGGGPGEGK
jgi:hypothetical protein